MKLWDERGDHYLGKRTIGSSTKNPKGINVRDKNQLFKLWIGRERARREQDCKGWKWNLKSNTIIFYFKD